MLKIKKEILFRLKKFNIVINEKIVDISTQEDLKKPAITEEIEAINQNYLIKV